MAFDAFVKVAAPKMVAGESTDETHKGWIEALSFDWGLTQGASPLADASGQPPTRPDFRDFRITKLVDSSSSELYKLCASGKTLTYVILEVCEAGGEKVPYFILEFRCATVSSVEPSGAATKAAQGGNAEPPRPVETVTFRYSEAVWKYIPVGHEGKVAATHSGGWDLKKNAPTI